VTIKRQSTTQQAKLHIGIGFYALYILGMKASFKSNEGWQ